MHLTLHLTNKCNLRCKYCFVELGADSMTQETANAAVDFAVADGGTTGILFYGGEPLLEKQLIYDTVAYTQAIKEKTGHTFYYKATTNGVLLDEEFLKFSQTINLAIGFSHDGPAQDECRVFPGGDGSFSALKDKIPLLLKYQPYAVAMSVIEPSTVHKAAAIVQFLFKKGFRYVSLNLNYSDTAPWTEKHLSILKGEYNKMAEMYIKWTKAEEKFYLSPFDVKILSHLKGEKYNEDRRKMAKNQLSVAPDGKIYYNSKHIGDPAFVIGDVFSGINADKFQALDAVGAIPPEPCQKCAIRTRCNYAYDNLTRQGSKIIPETSPIRCTHERLITPIADYVAEKLYRERNALFIHKHYNQLYPVMSLVEDTSQI